MRRPADLPRALYPSEPHAGSSECVARFEVRHTRFLDPEGNPIGKLPHFADDAGALLPHYRNMVLTRIFEHQAVALQRTGQLGTFPSGLGQEATAIAVGAALAREDVFLGSYRETGTMLRRGVRMHEILLYWGGDERGMDYSGPAAPREDFPLCVPIATHATHAAGVAYAFKLRHEPRVAVCVLGDGATSKGDFYEALNAAGVWQLPVVFVIVNNQWAISVHRDIQSHAQTLAQKAIAAGIEGEQVDGNDFIAVYDAMERALAKARRGDGPHVIEALTYRMGDHTTADDARRYRTADEVERQRALDPIVRLRKYLTRAGVWSEAAEQDLHKSLEAEVKQAVSDYLAMPPAPPDAMFAHLFERLPEALQEQRDSLREAHPNDPNPDSPDSPDGSNE
jgi:2-oxoisovalerate dehydrogenase E1 component alpha subunit